MHRLLVILVFFPLLYFIAGLFLELPYSPFGSTVFFVLAIVIQLNAHYSLKARLQQGPFLSLPQASKRADVFPSLATKVGIILLAFLSAFYFSSLDLSESLWQKPHIFLPFAAYAILQLTVFGKYDRAHYLTQEGVFSGMQTRRMLKWEKVASYQIVEKEGQIQFDAEASGTYTFLTTEGWLKTNKEEIKQWIEAHLPSYKKAENTGIERSSGEN